MNACDARRGHAMSEQDRLKALKSTRLLDSLREEKFDSITRLAANALHTDIALISLIDENRQWFKSTHGLDETETPREVAFCHHTIMQDDIMVVNNASEDPRFKHNPLVTGEPGIEFYAGVPLVTEDGHALGTLCVIDTSPRKNFTDQDKQMLTDLAVSVMTEVKNSQQSQVINDLSLVNEELRHRMGNMYAHVSALISMLGRDEEDIDRLVKRLREKINMLAATQALLATYEWTSVPLTALIETTLAPFMSAQNRKRITVQRET